MPQIGTLIRQMIKAGKDVLIEFKEFKSNRSLAQNKLMWKWNQEIAEHLRDHFGQENSSQDVHEVLVRKRFGLKVIQFGNEDPILVRKRTRKLSMKEFAEYLNWVDMYSAEYLQLTLSRPEDIYLQAIYGDRK
ncbi:recombination protein NinB [Pseudoalteromonas obscura]|uniref:Recombination protein NinB n=1 Tax=Pseudoalteromonas obscura TaxID=3048491 RepID=A0ABT7EK35_9GAMM|nr:recombination protein NinB [Pseudoalteromonas sp. P94(2023)]MDK2595420.1 recombination protein NinB [Pseudoalteromonas sp. P94(2023)]